MMLQFRERPIAAVLFDLDGTLLDTFNDIALALKRAFADHGLPAPGAQAVRTMIGRGAPTLVERASAAQGLTLDAQAKAQILERFFHHYGRLQETDECGAQAFPGVPQGLRSLHAAGVPLGIVTNKQQRFAQGLLQRLALAPYVKVVVGGDTCERRKPDPQPLLYAAGQLSSSAEHTLMVGDSVNDVTAARAAGMPVVCVPYGYNEGHDPRELPCDAFVETLAELPALLGLDRS
jgi:phosphoglycolate phosphatase